MSNDANEANFVENAGHIARLKSRIKKLSPAEEEARSEATEDAFDYYERSLQLRVMQNNTQKQLLDDVTEELRGAAASNRWLRTQRALLLLAAAAMVVWVVVPEETWTSEWKVPVAAHAAGAALLLLVLATVPIGGAGEPNPMATKMQ